MSEYFGGDAATQAQTAGTWVRWSDRAPIEMVPGLGFFPVVGANVLVNFVTFEPDTEAPVHWHDEEQITAVVEGEIEFELDGETRTIGRGDAVVIPSNVPHGARSRGGTALVVDVFQPPRQGIVDAMDA